MKLKKVMVFSKQGFFFLLQQLFTATKVTLGSMEIEQMGMGSKILRLGSGQYVAV